MWGTPSGVPHTCFNRLLLAPRDWLSMTEPIIASKGFLSLLGAKTSLLGLALLPYAAMTALKKVAHSRGRVCWPRSAQDAGDDTEGNEVALP